MCEASHHHSSIQNTHGTNLHLRTMNQPHINTTNAVLKNCCSQIIAKTLHSACSTPPLDWLDRLILTIHTGCQSYSTINATSSHFIPDYIVPEQVMSMKSRSRIVGKEQLIVETHRLLWSMLTKWVNIPCHFRAQAQQHLVQELLDHIGASVLYLPQTWIVYSTCPKWLLSPSIPTNYYKRGNQSSKYDKIYLEPFCPWINVLSNL